MSTAARMSGADALAEARTRFGPQAVVWVTQRGGELSYRIGVLTATRKGAKRAMRGCGTCWERAFLSADRRAAGLVHQGPSKTGAAIRTPLFDQEGRR